MLMNFNTLSLAGPHPLERLPAWGWLALHAAALWPHGHWVATRLMDGSDEPLGLAALAVLALALLHLAPGMRPTPRAAWAVASAACTGLATLALFWLPPLLGALLAALSFGLAVAAWLPEGVPRLPLMGLALLAMPLVASLQFYAGYPLRVLTAEVSAWLLQAAGFAAERSGAAMTVAGRLVIVDAPCSGVQLAWLAYFCACTAALACRLGDGALLRRMPLVACAVLVGNVLRNSALVALQALDAPVGEALHEGLGLGVLLAVCAAVLAIVARRENGQARQAH